MHIGSYDDEPATVALMHEYMEQQGYILDITEQSLHHEIYLSTMERTVFFEQLELMVKLSETSQSSKNQMSTARTERSGICS